MNRIARDDSETRVKRPRPHADVDVRGPLPLLFECSWEVCSQAGGIYTVIRSKAPAAIRRWGESYWLLGPYRERSARVEFEPQAPDGVVAAAVEELNARGVSVHCGRWLITGRPRVLLIDERSVWQHLGQMKYFLWKDHGIATPAADHETDEVIAFGHAAADLLAAIHQRLHGGPMIAHFHEWQAGVAVPLLKQRGVLFPTVFTTHATLVGRSLCSANVPMYENLRAYDPDKIADAHGIGHRFRLERAAAQKADVFTTVSEITAAEAEVFLGRRPDALLPNGLNVERFAAPHEFQNLHQRYKTQIHDFVMGHFFPSYTFDLDRTLYFFTAGRYEYRNKGIDVYLDALDELNRRLKAEAEGITVVAFIVTRAPYRGHNLETLNRQVMFNELRDACESIKDEMGRRLFRVVASGRLPTTDDLLDEYDRVRLKRMVYAWQQEPAPVVVTHDLVDDQNDPVLVHIRRVKLFNAPEDPVKIIYHPEFITPTSPVLGMEYDQFVRGCNLGVFPSYYEPWGYTPMECVVRGVPAISSDLSGFGAYVMKRFPDHDGSGMFVARRHGVEYGRTVYQVANWLHQHARLSLRERIALRNRVESFAEEFDWRKMSSFYRAARRMALEKYFPHLDVLRGD